MSPVLARVEEVEFIGPGTSKPLNPANPTVERRCYFFEFVGAKPKNLRGYMYQKCLPGKRNIERTIKKSN